MLELVFVHIEPTQCQGPGGDREVQLLEGSSHPTTTGLNFLPDLDLLAPSASPATRIVLGTQLVALLQEPGQVRVCPKACIQPHAHLLALFRAQAQDPFQGFHRLPQHRLAQLIAWIQQGSDAFVVVRRPNSTQLTSPYPFFSLK